MNTRTTTELDALSVTSLSYSSVYRRTNLKFSNQQHWTVNMPNTYICSTRTAVQSSSFTCLRRWTQSAMRSIWNRKKQTGLHKCSTYAMFKQRNATQN